MRKKIYLLLLAVSLGFACKKTPSNPPIIDPVEPNLTELTDGVTFFNNGTSAIVALYAPDKKSVTLIGEFNDWSATASPMQKTDDGTKWWIRIDNLNPNTEYAYQFLVDGNLRVADPYCEKILDPNNDSYINAFTYPNLKAYPTGKTTGIVSVMQGVKPIYTWKNTGFVRPEKNKLVIYELLIRDFTTEHSYASTLAKLDYLSNLGINAIELMPVNEFEGNLSWGYNPSFYFAPDKYYGTKLALRNFIDECHGRGIAVILDMVLSHSFGQSPMVQLYFDGSKPTANSPWFNVEATHPYNVGYDFNHESAATKNFAKNVMKFWMKEYKIDGFRFDLSKGFTQTKSTESTVSNYDASRIAIWKEYNSFIKNIDPANFYVILEHFAEASEEKVLAAEGMMLWNNMNYNMNEATMGWLGNPDFSWGFYVNHGFAKSENLVGYGESHDKERLNFKNLSYGNAFGNYVIKDNLPTSLKRQELLAPFLFSIPGPKMLWQFGELGYEVNIDYNGRTGEKPIRWEYFDDVNRKALYNVYAKMIKLKKNNSIFSTNNSSYSLKEGIKYIKLLEGNNTVVVVGNFDVVTQTATVDFGTPGVWYDVFGSNINLASSTYSATLSPGEYHVFSKEALK